MPARRGFCVRSDFGVVQKRQASSEVSQGTHVARSGTPNCQHDRVLVHASVPDSDVVRMQVLVQRLSGIPPLFRLPPFIPFQDGQQDLHDFDSSFQSEIRDDRGDWRREFGHGGTGRWDSGRFDVRKGADQVRGEAGRTGIGGDGRLRGVNRGTGGDDQVRDIDSGGESRVRIRFFEGRADEPDSLLRDEQNEGLWS